MNERINESKSDYKKRMTLGGIALQLIDDCYKGKPTDESKNDFLTKVSLLRYEGRKC
jgi:hypothetical protein